MRKVILIGIFVYLLQSCSNPAEPQAQISSVDFYINSTDYLLSQPGYFSTTKDCDLITEEVMKTGAVSVYYKPINQDYYLMLPQTVSIQGYIYNWNYSIRAGKIQFFTMTTNINDKSVPSGSTGTFHVVIFTKG
jgi:hypothetical protein